MKELHVKCLLPVRMDKYLMDQFPALSMGRLNKALRENKTMTDYLMKHCLLSVMNVLIWLAKTNYEAC